MDQDELIERLDALLTRLEKPEVPIELQLWDHGDVSAYFKRHPCTVREQITCLPGFPKAIRLPSKDRAAQPLYNAGEVIEWAMRHRDRHLAGLPHLRRQHLLIVTTRVHIQATILVNNNLGELWQAKS